MIGGVFLMDKLMNFAAAAHAVVRRHFCDRVVKPMVDGIVRSFRNVDDDRGRPEPGRPARLEVAGGTSFPNAVHDGFPTAWRSPCSPPAVFSTDAAGSILWRAARSWDSWPAAAERSFSKSFRAANQKGAPIVSKRALTMTPAQ